MLSNISNKSKTYRENYKTSLKEIKEHVNKWEDIPWSHIKQFTIIKMTLLPTLIYRHETITIKVPDAFLQ